MIMSAIYELDYSKLAVELLPTFLRNSRIRTLMRHSAMAMSRLHQLFKISRADDLFRESIDSSIPRLEFLLNTMFYSDGLVAGYNHRIIIAGNKSKTTAMHIWLGGVMQDEDEGKPHDLYTDTEEAEQLYLYTANEAGETVVDFIVKVPTVVDLDREETRMRAVLKRYALPGKEFQIVYY